MKSATELDAPISHKHFFGLKFSSEYLNKMYFYDKINEI